MITYVVVKWPACHDHNSVDLAIKFQLRQTTCTCLWLLLSCIYSLLSFYVMSFSTSQMPTFSTNQMLGFSFKIQGPVVQSIVSLTSSLRVISLTVLADSIYNILIFFAEKMWVAFALTFFSKKFQYICVSRDVNFNKSLTNDIISFEQLGPDI